MRPETCDTKFGESLPTTMRIDGRLVSLGVPAKQLPPQAMESCEGDCGWPVVDYCVEEVRRQGHDIAALDGLERVSWMLSAWLFALNAASNGLPRPAANAVMCVKHLGYLMEPWKNTTGFRRCEVRVGPNVVPTRAVDVPAAVERLLVLEAHMTPLEFYKAFEDLHPFMDGNGRVGKVLLNWKGGTLLKPVFPPADLWGERIMNP